MQQPTQLEDPNVSLNIESTISLDIHLFSNTMIFASWSALTSHLLLQGRQTAQRSRSNRELAEKAQAEIPQTLCRVRNLVFDI